ncbi:MAG: SGNH/GDSL hydrolase family protein [Armatimonadota bacterium]
MAFRLLSALTLVLLLLAVAPAPARPGAEPESPDFRWRLPVRPAALEASAGELLPGPDDGPPQLRWSLSLSPGQAAELRVPTRRARDRDLLLFTVADVEPKVPLRLTLLDADGAAAAEELLSADEIRVARQRSLILREADGRPATLRVELVPPENGSPLPERVEVTLSRMQFFRLSERSRPDAWLVVGASLEEAAFKDPDQFWRAVRRRYPQADPLLISLAQGGWVIDNALRRAPETLRRHPQIRTVLVHIGGNDITRARYYPNDAGRIRDRMRELLELLSGDGRQVYLSRMSYRAYKTEPRVPPEFHGSLPYNQMIYDPLIREYSPALLDPRTLQTRMDPYDYFLRHPEELSPDGVHNTEKGQESWIRLWTDAVTPLVYEPEVRRAALRETSARLAAEESRRNSANRTLSSRSGKAGRGAAQPAPPVSQKGKGHAQGSTRSGGGGNRGSGPAVAPARGVGGEPGQGSSPRSVLPRGGSARARALQ